MSSNLIKGLTASGQQVPVRVSDVGELVALMLAQLPAALGQQANTQSLSVTLASDFSLVTNLAAAAGTPDQGNPLKVGGVYNSTLPTLTTGQRGDIPLDSRGNLRCSLSITNGTTGISGATCADGLSNVAGLAANAQRLTFNGTNWDRVRGNVDATLLAAAFRTATTSAADQTNYNNLGVHVILDVTSLSAGSLTLKIEGKDSTSGKYFALLTGPMITATGTFIYSLYPGIAAGTNAANSVLPRVWRVTVTHQDGSSIGYSVGSCLIN
jgi:hypothetical protein